MPITEAAQGLVGPPVVLSLGWFLPLYDLVVPGLARVLVGLGGEGGGLVEGELGDLEVSLVPDRSWLSVMPDLQLLGEGKVRPSVQAGPGSGLPVDWSYEGPLGVLRSNEVLRRLSGDVTDRF